jgi:tetratricopeptide (TPR) repeat protein
MQTSVRAEELDRERILVGSSLRAVIRDLEAHEDEDSERWHYLMARALVRQMQYREATWYTVRALKLDPQSPLSEALDAWLQCILHLDLAGREARLVACVEAHPDLALPRQLLGDLLVYLGSWEAALSLIHAAPPDLAGMWQSRLLRADALRQGGRAEEAAREESAALEALPRPLPGSLVPDYVRLVRRVGDKALVRKAYV